MRKRIALSVLPSIVADVEILNDDQLIERCMQLGSLSVKARRMFMGLLPLVARRKAYNIKKFSSIYHFASVVGGVGYGLVEEILRLDRQLDEFPKLRKVMYSGEIGWAKIRLAISMVTKDSQDRWLQLLRTLSKPALEVHLRDFRKQTKDEERNLFSINMNEAIETTCVEEEKVTQPSIAQKSAIIEAESFPGKTFQLDDENKKVQVVESQPTQISAKQEQLSAQRETLSLNVNSWLAAQLRLFRRKLEKEQKKLITWEDVLAELLKNAA